MKRLRSTTRITFPVLLALATPVLWQGCGGTEARRYDGGRDVPPIGLDGGKFDLAVERGRDSPPPGEVGPPVDTAKADVAPGLDVGPTKLDASADVPIPPPDTPILTDVPLSPAEVGTPDLKPADVPLGADAPPALDTAAIDAPAIDVQPIDTAHLEAARPGAITGWPTATIDFGPSPCGGEAPAARTFTLTNASESPVTVTRARFSGAAGYTTDAEGKVVPAGGSLVVSIQAPAVPQTTNIPTSYDAVLTLQTDIAGDDQHLVSVTESAQGAILTWDTGADFGSFGALSPGHTTSASFHVINMGNVAADVALTTTGQFSVTSQSPVTIASRSASDSVVAFVPSIGGTAIGSLAMGLATPVAVCQPVPGPLALTGTSINGALAMSAVSLSFASECNRETTAQTLTVTNTGTVAMTWSAALATGAASKFALSPTTSTLTPTTETPEPSTAITVTSTIPTSSAVVSDTIEVLTDAVGDTAHAVVLTQTPLGNVVSVLGAGAVELGSVPIVSPALTSAPVTVTLRNDANPNSAPAVVTLQMTGPQAAYFTVTPTQVSIPAGSQAEVTVTFSPGTNSALVTSGDHVDLTATLHWEVGTEANCGAASGDVTVNATATLGQVSGVPGQLDFGLVNCGAIGGQQQITVTNSGTASYSVTEVALASSTYFAVEHAALPKLLTAGGSMVITVTPNAVPATLAAAPDLGRFSSTLTITTDLLGDVPHQVALLMGARGAIITNSPWPTDWDFGIAPFPGSRRLYIPVVNNGNVPVIASLEDIIVAPEQVNVFTLAGTVATLAPNRTSNIEASFQPNEPDSTFTATANLRLSVASDAVFCQPLPAGWNSTAHNIHMQGQSASSAPQPQ